MKLNKFLQEFKLSNDKNEFMKKHIVKDYINYEEKLSDCKKIVKLTMWTKINDKSVFKINTPGKFELFSIKLIERYTDIELGDDLLSDYNDIQKNNILELLMTEMPHSELLIYQDLLSMCTDDEIENYRSIPGFLESKFAAITTLLEQVEPLLSSLIKE